MKSGFKSAFFIASMIISWSVYYAVSKVIVNACGSAFAGGFLLRSAAFLFLTIQLAATGGLKQLFSCGSTVKLLLLVGLLGFSQDILANLGYASGSLSTGTALLKTDVIMANLVTVIVYKKKLYLSDWVGTALMLIGVFMVMGLSFRDMSFHPGDIFFILSAAALTANAFVVKAVQRDPRVSTDTISYYNNFLVMTLSFCGAFATGAMSFSAIGDVISNYLPLILLGGLAQTGVYFFYYRNLSTREVWTVKLYLLLIPICSLFIGVFLLDEMLTVAKILGIFIILAGSELILLREKLNRTEGRSNE